MVRSPDEDRHAARFEYVVDSWQFAQLDLQTLGEGFNNAGELADADHSVVRQVSDPRPSQDRCHVMLAVAFKWNAAQHDHFVIAFDLIKGLLKDRRRVLRVADECLFKGAFHPSWGLD
jgi:hypothetical protein